MPNQGLPFQRSCFLVGNILEFCRSDQEGLALGLPARRGKAEIVVQKDADQILDYGVPIHQAEPLGEAVRLK